MRKFFGLLLLLSLTQIGIAYAGTDASTTPVANRDYIFGLSKSSTVNLNQVLFLLAGKDGKNGRDGIDGIAGKDGINGVNGVNGTNGINGVDGKDGAPGPAGAQGLAGPAGPAGPAGAPGNGNNGANSDLRYGAAAVRTGACTDTATVGLKALFTGDDFVFDYVNVKDVDTHCGTGDKKFAFYVKINSAPLMISPKVADAYRNGEVVKCVFTIPLLNTWGPNTGIQFRLEGDNRVCTIVNPVRSGPVFSLNDISTSDYARTIGFEIYSE